MATPVARTVGGNTQSAGFLAPTATISIPASGALVGDLIIMTVTSDSGSTANWNDLPSPSAGWTRLITWDAGNNLPKMRIWWKVSTTSAAQSYSVSFTDGVNWAQVSNWQAWQAGTFNTDTPLIQLGVSYNGSDVSPYPSNAMTAPGLPDGAGDYIATAVYSLWNGTGPSAPGWGTRPSGWTQTANQESTGNYNSQYAARTQWNPGTSSGTLASATFTVNDSATRRVLTGGYVINPQFDARSGAGYARLGLSARSSGTATRKGTPNARLGERAPGAGSKRAVSNGEARAGLRGPAVGVKRAAGVDWSTSLGLTSRAAGPKRGISTAATRTPGIGLSGYGVEPPPIPVFNGRPLTEDPLPLATSRYLVQNILTGEWLHTDLPLTEDTTTLTLSGPCEIAGKIAPEQADLKAPDGTPLLRSWGHVIYLEMDGEIRAAGLITEDSYDDQTQSLVCKGVSAYPGVITYQDVYTRYNVDPLQVVVDMWAYVQSFPNGNLGVSVARMGVPELRLGVTPKQAPSQPRGYLSDGSAPDPAIPQVKQSSVTPAVWARLLALGYLGRANDSVEALYVPTEVVDKAKADVAAGAVFTTADTEIEPYKVNWWDVKTPASVIDEVVKACPADYVEQYGWNYPHTFVDQQVLVAYPRIGRRRDDLRFVQGENITSAPGLESNPDGYATHVVGIGAGEGSAALRETAEVVIPGRVRKTYVYRNSSITDRQTLARIVRDQLNQRSLGGYEITTVQVLTDNDNARFGSYNVGDDVLVQVLVPHYGWVQQWGRILSITLARGVGLAELKLKRSDSFYYGREVES